VDGDLERVVGDDVHPGAAVTGRPHGSLLSLQGVEAALPLVQIRGGHDKADPSVDEVAPQNDLCRVVPLLAVRPGRVAPHLDGDALTCVFEPEQLQRLRVGDHGCLSNV
jgi:hypothetical protein